MRIKRSYTNKWRVGVWLVIGSSLYDWYDPEKFRWMKQHNHELWLWSLNYDQFKRREQWRWSQYLRGWDPYQYGNLFLQNMGYLSNTVFDKMLFGEKRFQDPPSYEKTANDFMERAESSGVDPAQPLLDSITKVVKAYYPHDLDENPEETKTVLKPKIKWAYESDFDEIVEENDKKPKPNSLARYLWFVPGYQDYFEWVKGNARDDEEKILTSLNRDERQIFYETIDELTKRWGQELNDYAPLLAHRWDRKLKLATYLMRKDESHQTQIKDMLMEPGGVKQIFIKAGIITPSPDDYVNTN